MDMSTLPSEAVGLLRQVLGPDSFSVRPEDLLTHSFDAAKQADPPAGVAWPVSTEQVSRIMRLAAQYRFPVVPRGMGSGLTGGSVPVAGGLVVSLNRMDRVIEISPRDLTAVVQPGVINARFQQMVEAQGLFFPPDPGSAEFSSLGGNAAENAGGLRAVKYGVTRDYVMGLTAVIPGGEVIHTGVRTHKGVVGYDLTGLIVGSEGTLAVITEMILRLIPKPEAKRTVEALFDHPTRASLAVAEIMAAGMTPTALEFIDHASLRAVDHYLKLNLPDWARAILLIELDGPPEVVDRHMGRVQGILEKCGAGQVRTAIDAPQADVLWRARRAIGPAVYALAVGKINEDVVVPLSRVPDMVERLEAMAAETGLIIPTFGHLGDGNLHVNVMYHPDQGQTELAHDTVSRIFDLTLELGGTLSGEHGVGLSKRPFIGREVDPVTMRLMKEIKKVFDPDNLLNPNKIYPDD
jgi:glycolate oxidase subunit GlcD